MSRFKKIALTIIAIPVAGLICLWALFFCIEVADGSYAFRKSVESIQPGMSKSEVISRLGQEYKESKVPCYMDILVFENPPLQSFRSKASYYLFWGSPGIANEIYSVGFDAEDRVVGTVYGTS